MITSWYHLTTQVCTFIVSENYMEIDNSLINIELQLLYFHNIFQKRDKPFISINFKKCRKPMKISHLNIFLDFFEIRKN